MAHLPSKTFGFQGGYTEDSHLGQGRFHGIQFVRFYDGFDHLHTGLLARFLCFSGGHPFRWDIHTTLNSTDILPTTAVFVR